MRKTEIVIVGAGLAGSAAAVMLARAGVNFLIIDPDRVYPWDFRCEKLDASQRLLLRKAGLEDVILPSASMIDKVWVVRMDRFVQKRDNRQIGIYYDTLVNCFRAAFPSEQLLVGKVVSIAPSDDRQTISLSDGQQISARLVILATGTNHALRTSLGIERKILSPNHSISLGYDLKPIGRPRFDFPALTYNPSSARDRISYLTLFPIGDAMRANLFVYRDPRDPWLGKFREEPDRAMLEAMPGLGPLLGRFEVTTPVKIRPIDLYTTSGYKRDGVVIVGDAFATSCPAAGTGANKAFTDIERLCNVYIPRWLATPGMGRAKIAAFYDDPEKNACETASRNKAYRLRTLATDLSLAGRLRRGARRIAGVVRGALANEPATGSVAVETSDQNTTKRLRKPA